jgi:hypothetical protein
MNGKGMEHGSPAFIPLPSIPLPLPLEVLDCGFAALRSFAAKKSGRQCVMLQHYGTNGMAHFARRTRLVALTNG